MQEISLQSILNAPAEQNAANNPEDKTEAKKKNKNLLRSPYQMVAGSILYSAKRF